RAPGTGHVVHRPPSGAASGLTDAALRAGGGGWEAAAVVAAVGAVAGALAAEALEVGAPGESGGEEAWDGGHPQGDRDGAVVRASGESGPPRPVVGWGVESGVQGRHDELLEADVLVREETAAADADGDAPDGDAGRVPAAGDEGGHDEERGRGEG